MAASVSSLFGRWWFHLLILLVGTAVSLPINGYTFGIYDHAYHLARLQWLQDPTLYNPRDPFLATLEVYPSVFWSALLPLSALIPLPVLFLGLYYLSQCLFGYAMLRFARYVYGSELVAWCSFGAFLLMKVTSGLYEFPDGQFLPRTLVFPAVVFAFELFLRKHWALSFLVAGLMIQLHGLVAAHLLILLNAGLFWQIWKSGPKQTIVPFICEIVSVLPAVVWRLQNPGDIPLLAADPTWVRIVKLALPTVQNILVIEPAVVFAHLSTLGFLLIFMIAQRHHPAAGDRQETLNLWVATVLCTILLSGIFTDVIPLAGIMQFEFIRIGMFLPFFALPSFSNYVIMAWQHREIPGPSCALLLLTAILTPFGSITSLAALVNALGRRFTIGLIVLCVCIITLSGYFFVFKHLTSPMWLTEPPNNSWVQTAQWAKENTPGDAIFLTPTYLDTARYRAEFRLIAQRSVVVSRHEGDQVAFSYTFALEWYQRMHDLSNGLYTLDAPLANSDRITEQGFRSLSEEDLVALARTYGASYLVLEADRQFSLPIKFKNSDFVIYAVPI